ncbi:hypothetical protein [Streptomyces pseudogriseolus]|uniref:hypothetical protein n=1 Tax=Streptomyces pseudogriseolus TaxID=36817 RepID=UPI003FA1E272
MTIPPTPAPTPAPAPYTASSAHFTRHPMCDCGACCDACGHQGCTSQSPEVRGDSD